MSHGEVCEDIIVPTVIPRRPVDDTEEDDCMEEEIVAQQVVKQDSEVNQMLLRSFRAIAGSDNEIDADELRQILNVAFQREFPFNGFSLECCRSMLALVDRDCSGKLGFSEFKAMWGVINKWKVMFRVYDNDRSGMLTEKEFASALKDTGLDINSGTMRSLFLRYSREDKLVPFDEFIMCAVRLWKMQSVFDENKQHGNSARIRWDDYLLATMYS